MTMQEILIAEAREAVKQLRYARDRFREQGWWASKLSANGCADRLEKAIDAVESNAAPEPAHAAD